MDELASVGMVAKIQITSRSFVDTVPGRTLGWRYEAD
jgi:hypothetical protein